MHRAIADSILEDAISEPVAAPAPQPVAHGDAPLTVIERKPGWKFLDLSEMWKYRELLYFLIWRDVKVRYKQTVLGVLWAVVQPLATMVVFSLFFGRYAELKSGGIPYPLYVFAGLLPWTFFSNAITQAGGSVVGSQNLVTKVYFPRLFIPLGAVGAGLVDLLIAFGMLVVLMLCYGVYPGWGFLLLPFLVGLLVIAAVGAGSLLAALTVAYRDFRHVVPFLVQLWMFATPTIYMHADTFSSPRWRVVLPLNPAYGLILNFQRSSLGDPLDLFSLGVSSAMAVAFLLAGCLYFRRVERSFADII